VSGWESFFIAEVGASAALAGLVFVGVSISLAKILAYPSLPGRALESLVVLLLVLVLSSLLLIPEQSFTAVGLEILFVGLAGWLIMIALHVTRARLVEPEYRRRTITTILLGEIAVIPLVIAGIVTLARGESGLYWVVAGVILCFLDAMTNAWVLLIEINR
jgi:modulator of FtsH protease